MDDSQADVTVLCRDLWKVFGAKPEETLAVLQQEQSKDHILEQTGHVLAVRGVSFDVHKGETFVVMGLSGSGKSTLLRCLIRLIEPSQGQVIVDGEDLTAMNARQLREVRRHKFSMVFQHFGLFPHRRIIDNVAYGLEVQGIRKAKRYEKAFEVLELVNLKGWENHYPGQLSGGMQQRVGLARALAVDPEILLFDEPFSALDPLIRREMQDELIALQERMHKTLIFITHDFAEAIKLGDQIAIMKDGEFVQVGTPESVVLQPADGYVAEFTKDVPKSKVLTAHASMRPVAGNLASDQSVLVSVTLNELIPLLAETDQAFPVVDEDGNLVGCIDRTAVMMALGPSGVVGHRAEEPT
jgi:glycine betaine/proline transport system ATP-binding protein